MFEREKQSLLGACRYRRKPRSSISHSFLPNVVCLRFTSGPLESSEHVVWKKCQDFARNVIKALVNRNPSMTTRDKYLLSTVFVGACTLFIYYVIVVRPRNAQISKRKEWASVSRILYLYHVHQPFKWKQGRLPSFVVEQKDDFLCVWKAEIVLVACFISSAYMRFISGSMQLVVWLLRRRRHSCYLPTRTFDTDGSSRNHLQSETRIRRVTWVRGAGGGPYKRNFNQK